MSTNAMLTFDLSELSELMFYYGEEPPVEQPADSHFLKAHYYTDAPILTIRSVLQQFYKCVKAAVTKDELYEMRCTVDEVVKDETDETVFQVRLFSNTSPTRSERYVIEILKLRGDSYVFTNCVRSAQTIFTSSKLISPSEPEESSWADPSTDELDTAELEYLKSYITQSIIRTIADLQTYKNE